MNEDEKKAAEALLNELQAAKSTEVVQFATAYQALTQGALNRTNAEAPKQ